MVLRDKKLKYGLMTGIILVFLGSISFNKYVENKVGKQIDGYNNVKVYYNGYIWNVSERNQTKEGYNIGLKYQCVEFVKRYYFEHLNHKMPNSFGHAKDFFDKKLKNGQINVERGLVQYLNGEGDKPEINDIIVFSPSLFNSYGHVAIVCASDNNSIEVIQQNAGLLSSSRQKFDLLFDNQKFRVNNNRVLGWLRKKSSSL